MARSSKAEKHKPTVLITGANRGLGLGLVKAFAARGDRVLAACREPERATALQALPLSSAKDISVLRLDVTDAASVAAARAMTGDRPLDGLINNAGVIGPERQSTLDMDFDGFAETLAVDTLGPLRVVQAFLPNLRAASRPKILTITSRLGTFASGGSDRVAYRAAKAALNRVMQALALDLEPEGIAVGLIHPGWVRTEMGGSAGELSVDESVAGIMRVFDALSIESTGRLQNYDGSEMPW